MVKGITILRTYLPVVLEGSGALAVLGAVGLLFGPAYAALLGGMLAIGAGFLLGELE
jgi:hypothetical protein